MNKEQDNNQKPEQDKTKIVLQAEEKVDQRETVIRKLPSEALQLIQNIMSNNEFLNNQVPEPPADLPSVDNLPPEAAELAKQIMANTGNPQAKLPPQEEGLLRRMVIQEKMNDNQINFQSPIKKFTGPLPPLNNAGTGPLPETSQVKPGTGPLPPVNAPKPVTGPLPPVNSGRPVTGPLQGNFISSNPGKTVGTPSGSNPGQTFNSNPGLKTGNSVPVTPPPPPPPKPSSQKNNIDWTIYETGSVFGIQINKTRRDDVIEIMKSISKVTISGRSSPILNYDDIGVIFTFREGGNLQEITLNYPYRGATSMGLVIDDPIEKAIKLYGQPRMRTGAGAIWNNISVFLRDDLVTSIRLRES